MAIDLTRFGSSDAARCADALRRALTNAPTAEAAADASCRLLHDELVGPDGERACVLVRCYTTQPYGALPGDLQRFAKRAYGAVAITPPEPAMRCLVLLATAGLEPAWNDRRQSAGHQAIPLPTSHIVERAPMIAQLVRELGLDLAHVVRPKPGLVRDLAGPGRGTFFVENASGSPYIPAQDFVARYGVRSVLGFGGLLSSGELGAAILFTRVGITPAAAERFEMLAGELTRGLGAEGRPVITERDAADRTTSV
jgi:hypothetical protein